MRPIIEPFNISTQPNANHLVFTMKNPEKGREATTPSNIKEIQEIQVGREAPHDGDGINPKDA